jgi:acyl-coenzyme A thioesterase PaaI-like protein
VAGREARVALRDPHARRTLRAREDGSCFACGADNPIGLKLDFDLVGGGTETTFVPAHEHQGFAGIVHGGMVGLVLDEAMAKALSMQGIKALTCEFTMRLRRAVTVGEPLRVTARLVRARKRLFELEAAADGAAGETVATARAKFLRVGASVVED